MPLPLGLVLPLLLRLLVKLVLQLGEPGPFAFVFRPGRRAETGDRRERGVQGGGLK